MRIKSKIKTKSVLACVISFIFSILINVVATASAHAQFSGGSQTGSAEATLGSDIFTGGAQTGTTSATSGANGSLSHGDATHIAFLVSPSSVRHSNLFERQPIVAILDASNNVVASDQTTQITVTIQNNPGAGKMLGTTTISVVNGLAQFTDLQIERAGQMFTLQAAADGLGVAVSEPFDIFPGTGPKFAAVYDQTENAYYIYSWLETDGERQPLNSATTCGASIAYVDSGTYTTDASLSMTVETAKNWCYPGSSWAPTKTHGSYFIDLNIYQNGITNFRTYSPLDISAMKLSAVNWDNILDMKADLGKVNWDDLEEMTNKNRLINWDDIARMSKSAVNWENMGVLMSDVVAIKDVTQGMTGFNWSGAQELASAGVNWTGVNAMTAAGINWDDLYQMTTQGVNWQDIDIMSQIGINWDDLGTMSGAAINWFDIGRMTTSGVNWILLHYQPAASIGMTWKC
jgi:hypothetical protein